MATTVALFEQSGCPTAGAEEFLRRNRTEFADYDISKDEVTRRRLVEELNSGATATLVIDGEIIMGFRANRASVAELLRDRAG